MSAGFDGAKIVGSRQNNRVDAVHNPFVVRHRPIRVNAGNANGAAKFFGVKSRFFVVKIRNIALNPSANKAIGRKIGQNAHHNHRFDARLFCQNPFEGLPKLLQNRVDKVCAHRIASLESAAELVIIGFFVGKINQFNALDTAAAFGHICRNRFRFND